MRDFFRGWKRKIGVVTLVLSCLFSAGWVRSRTVADSIDLNRILIGSEDSSFVIVSVDHQAFYFPVWRATKPHDLSEELGRIDNFIFLWRSCGVVCGHYGNGRGNTIVVWIAPYWSIVIPLTLLSAYVLLSKPRQPRQSDDVTAASESAPQSGDPPLS